LLTGKIDRRKKNLASIRHEAKLANAAKNARQGLVGHHVVAGGGRHPLLLRHEVLEGAVLESGRGTVEDGTIRGAVEEGTVRGAVEEGAGRRPVVMEFKLYNAKTMS